MNIFSGGSRISQRGVRQLQRWGRQPIIFANFPQKLHEIEEIWIKRGGGARPWRPPLDPPMILDYSSLSKWNINSDLS